MKFFLNKILLLVLMVSFFPVIGCGGFGASGTVSPLMFLMPGAYYDKSNNSPITTNKSIIASSEGNIEEFKTNCLSLNNNQQ